MTIRELTALPDAQVSALLTRCMDSPPWLAAMLAARPFASREALHAAAERAAGAMKLADWLRAFEAHPRIGDLESLRTKYASTAAWAEGEQAGAAGADEATLVALAEANHEYEEKFGFRFIVFASGKSAAELLAILRERLARGRPESEWRIAAVQASQIMHLRLDRLIQEDA